MLVFSFGTRGVEEHKYKTLLKQKRHYVAYAYTIFDIETTLINQQSFILWKQETHLFAYVNMIMSYLLDLNSSLQVKCDDPFNNFDGY
jgi:hypothetical protein